MSTAESSARALPRHMTPNVVVTFVEPVSRAQSTSQSETVQRVYVIRYDAWGERAEPDEKCDGPTARRAAGVERHKAYADPGRERMLEPWLNYCREIGPGVYEISAGSASTE